MRKMVIVAHSLYKNKKRYAIKGSTSKEEMNTD
jgi:hypothetical protein